MDSVQGEPMNERSLLWYFARARPSTWSSFFPLQFLQISLANFPLPSNAQLSSWGSLPDFLSIDRQTHGPYARVPHPHCTNKPADGYARSACHPQARAPQSFLPARFPKDHAKDTLQRGHGEEFTRSCPDSGPERTTHLFTCKEVDTLWPGNTGLG